MSYETENALDSAVTTAVRQAGLSVLSAEHGTTANNEPTSVFLLSLPDAPAEGHTSRLELRSSLDLSAKPGMLEDLVTHLQEETRRLRNPVPEAYVTFGGLPITMTDFAWPFHHSVSGADTYVVHGLVTLQDGTDSGLHAKISASLTLTFADIIHAPEQPYAETFIYNAIRKTLDQGQLEMLKSGNRQPVPVTTRYYSRWKKDFIFTDTDDEKRRQFLASKVFWLSGVLGESRPIWIADRRDSQYMNTTPDALRKAAAELASEGLTVLREGEFASATPKLMDRADEYRARLQESLDFTKPTFNEEMRAGHTNM